MHTPEGEDVVGLIVLLHFSDKKGSRSKPVKVLLTLLLAQPSVDTLQVREGRTGRGARS